MRAKILVEATRLFARHGYDGTSLQAIADAVGIKKPSLIHHFASKDLLRQAVLDAQLAHWNELLPRLVLAAAAGEDQFDAVTREIVRFFSTDPDRARLLVREALDRPEDMQERFSRLVVPVVGSLAQLIRRGRGKVVHADVDAEAYVFHAINLFISGVAFADSFQRLMPDGKKRGPAPERLTRELLRIGKSSLIQPRTQQPNELTWSSPAPVNATASGKRTNKSKPRASRAPKSAARETE
ncbi:MAG: TetR/AcrR family transcriptional regulator [Polyangiaceae bacterium]|nr:TetR/AcrR family transcriptional regulator [Polyangiaceae bacterium]MCB9605764.1 TetR/AcrR family transcriptional regulator [Polyangiaceae bacterium]